MANTTFMMYEVKPASSCEVLHKTNRFFVCDAQSQIGRELYLFINNF